MSIAIVHVPFELSEELQEVIREIEGPRHRFPEDIDAKSHIKTVEAYIIEKLQASGWDVKEQTVDFKNFTTYWGETVEDINGVNIIAQLPGESDKTIIIACHHDTVLGSPGADDNGSGIAVLLLLSRLLSIDQSFKHSIMLISFDLEEIGLIGSSYFVEHYTEFFNKKEQILGVIVLETLGYYSDEEDQQLPAGFGLLYRGIVNRLKQSNRLKSNFVTVIYNSDSVSLIRSFKEIEKQERGAQNHIPIAPIRHPVDIPIIGPILRMIFPTLGNLLRSDHTPFWYQDIPAIMITDTANFRNPHYHLPTDTLDTINFESLAKVTIFIYKAIIHYLESYND